MRLPGLPPIIGGANAILHEQEIFSLLSDKFKSAATKCELLAQLPAQGPTYASMREDLKMLESACRQAAQWREDARWLRVGLLMEEAHQRSLFWLRYRHPRALFLKLAENLRQCHRLAEGLRDNATGKVGAILPDPEPMPLRDTKPVQVITPGGILLPGKE